MSRHFRRFAEWLWQELAWTLCLPAVVDWLIARAERRPYFHLQDPDGSYYMRRFWLFNPYTFGQGAARTGWRSWFPSVRLHHIMRRDLDEHMHDHPWEARTIILRGSYKEERLEGTMCSEYLGFRKPVDIVRPYLRLPGDTCRLDYGTFHNISQVSLGGVWTLFITWKYKGVWGFRVDGEKIPHKVYLGTDNPFGRKTPNA